LTKHKVQIDASLDEQQLVDPMVIKRFTEYCEIQPDETVLEIGPGAGNISEALLEKARYLICIEKNPKYLPVLSERFKESTKLKLITDDALKTYLPKHDRLASNLPYMITEAFFQRTLRLGFKSATLIVPLGFADTLQVDSFEKEYTKLSFLSQLFYDINYHETVPPEAYLPEPRTSTAIITLKPRPSYNNTEKILIELIKQGDKYTKNALRESLIRAEVCASKKEARKHIDSLNLEQKILQSFASRLSLSDLQALEQRL
jgi:16S rRNA A1518/A1519 N6-dimethyltransferase RsmA/KsgA/DIM1 with predicted DNA glycosylase/AP lyase activity